MENDNLHAGHRERMIERLLNSPDSLSDHELLEVLLFRSLPRINTNPVAHRLLNFFGTIDKVLNAKKEELVAIEGIGEKTASDLILSGKLIEGIIRAERKKSAVEPVGTLESARKALYGYFEGLNEEHFVVWFLDKKFVKQGELVFSDMKEGSVSINLPEVARVMALKMPSYVIIAHNHIVGSALPSKEDDESTEKFEYICRLHNVRLADHLIFSNGDEYSYFINDKLHG